MNQTESKDTLAMVGVVAGCLIKQHDKYLLVQEKKAKAYGLWNLPAGKVDRGESIGQAAVREVREETGYIVTLGQEIGLYHESVDRAVKHIFTADIIGGEPMPQEDEILAVQWLTFDEIRKLNENSKLRAPWIWEIVQKAQ